jgi:hypothetical protein
MNSRDGHFDLSLQPQAMFSVPDAAGVQVHCRRGSVWITLDGDGRDLVLQAGDSFVTPEHRRVLIYALGPACISVMAPAPAHARPFARADRTRSLVLEQVVA